MIALPIINRCRFLFVNGHILNKHTITHTGTFLAVLLYYFFKMFCKTIENSKKKNVKMNCTTLELRRVTNTLHICFWKNKLHSMRLPRCLDLRKWDNILSYMGFFTALKVCVFKLASLICNNHKITSFNQSQIWPYSWTYWPFSKTISIWRIEISWCRLKLI